MLQPKVATVFTGYLPPNKNSFTLRTSPFGTIKRGQVPEKTKYKYMSCNEAAEAALSNLTRVSAPGD